MRLILAPEAEQDLESAFDWYESERAGLGIHFVLAVEAALASILRHPESFALAATEVRRAPVRRFPYGVFFLIGWRVDRRHRNRSRQAPSKIVDQASSSIGPRSRSGHRAGQGMAACP